MPGHLEVRDYQPNDQDVLPGLFMRAIQSVYPGLQDGAWVDDLRDVEANYIKDGGAVLVGIEGETRVAMGAIKMVDETTGEMKRVAVDPEHQGEGMGQQLLDAIEKRAKELGMRRMVLDTTSKQVAAQRLYEKNGYTLVKREPELAHPSGNTFDTLFYEKELADTV